MYSNLTIIHNSLAENLLGILRNKNTSASDFRMALDRLGHILVIEALKNSPTETIEIETLLEKTEAKKLKGETVIIPILRAGLSMLSACLYFLPNAQIGFIGQKRDEETALAQEYYRNLPDLKNKEILIIDPVLATGGSVIATIKALLEKNASVEQIKLLCILAAPEGVKALELNFPNLQIITISLERELNEKKYILPGLGDAGDLWAGLS
jgi:uracil phosphoribosyltransferase